MKILKPINNNVVSCLDEHGTELVLMGKGLGFQAKAGMEVRTELVEKVFTMDTPEEARKLKNQLERLSPEMLELCSGIVDYANEVLGRRLNQSIYLTLTDHIEFAIERCRQGMDLRNALGTEVRVFYPEEYAIGRYALEQIQQKTGISLAEDEAACVALHLINAEYDNSMNVTMRVARVLHPLVEILETWPGLNLDRESIYYDELIVHLKFLAMQAFTAEDRGWTEVPLEEALRRIVPESYACARAMAEYLTEQCGNRISMAEQAYLAICIRRASRMTET